CRLDGLCEPAPIASRAMQREKRRPHLDAVGEVGAGSIPCVMAEAAVRQAPLAKRPFGTRDRECQGVCIAGGIVISGEPLDRLTGLACVFTRIDAGMAVGHAHRDMETTIRCGELVFQEAVKAVGGVAISLV